MKTTALLLCLSLALPMMATPVDAPTPPQGPLCAKCAEKAPMPPPEMGKCQRPNCPPKQDMKPMPKCENAECPCAKVMAERPQPPKINPAEMSKEERAAFRQEMKATFEAFRAKMEEARKACTCEKCICKHPKMSDKRMKKRMMHKKHMMYDKKCPGKPMPPPEMDAPVAPETQPEA